MSYSHISLGLGAVVLILVGGFIAIILIDLLFDYFDGLTKWLAARQQEGIQHVRRIDHEAKRELQRIAMRVPATKSAGPMGRGSPRPGGVSRPGTPAEGMVNAEAQSTTHTGPPAGVFATPGCGCDKCQALRRLANLATSSRWPGRGDPPKGVRNGSGE